MSTSSTLLQAIKNSLSRGSKMLIGSLSAAVAGHIVSLYSMAMTGKASERDFATPIGLMLPGSIAGWVFILIATLSGFGALLALRRARSIVVRIIHNQRKVTSDNSWIEEIQSVLFDSSSISTNPTVIRILCFFASSLQLGSLFFLMVHAKGIHTLLGFFVVLILYGSVLIIPFAFLIWNRWLIMFKPDYYDKENISIIW